MVLSNVLAGWVFLPLEIYALEVEISAAGCVVFLLLWTFLAGERRDDSNASVPDA